MRKNKRPIKTLILVGIILILGVYYINSYDKYKGIKVVEWNNIYNENNINIFYEDLESEQNEKLAKLDSTYRIDEIIKEETKEIDKILKTVDILNSIVNYDDVADSVNSDGYSILKDKGENRKVSARDMAIIERDIMLIAGYNARIGVLRQDNPQLNSNSSYYVVEYWSEEHGKWVMIDFRDKGYFLNGETPLSTVEVLNSDIKDITYVGQTEEKKYRKDIEKYLKSYSIPIDNTLINKRSNSYICYIKDEKNIELKGYNSFIPPTIFTMEEEMFNLKPGSVATKEDEGVYIILMKKSPVVEKDKETVEDNTFVLGGFQNSSILSEYYIRINNLEYEKVNMHKEIELPNGETKIEISLDGVNTVGSVVIVNEK